jgi:hypothetical protein
MKNKLIVFVAVVLVLAFTAIPVLATVNLSRFDNVLVDGVLLVGDAVTMDSTLSVGNNATVAGTLAVTGASTLTGNVVAAGNITVDDYLILDKAAANVTVTAGSTITPTAMFQPITAAGAVTTSTSVAVADGAAVGQLLILHNVGAQAITVDGTGGNVECKTDVVLGAKDNLTVMWDGADWVCIGAHDN